MKVTVELARDQAEALLCFLRRIWTREIEAALNDAQCLEEAVDRRLAPWPGRRQIACQQTHRAERSTSATT